MRHPPVTDRLWQQAIAQWLDLKYEAEFPITAMDLEKGGMRPREGAYEG